MAVALPICPIANEASPFLRDFGGDLTPFLGGPEQRINRLGTRLACTYVMPALDDAEARQLYTRLMVGKQSSVVVPWPLFDFDPGNPPGPEVAVSGTGMAIQINGLGAGYDIREGQPFSVIHAGIRYMHIATGGVTADGSGVANVSFFPPTRLPYSAGDIVEITAPMLEGKVEGEVKWTQGLDNSVTLTFTVVERG